MIIQFKQHTDVFTVRFMAPVGIYYLKYSSNMCPKRVSLISVFRICASYGQSDDPD